LVILLTLLAEREREEAPGGEAPHELRLLAISKLAIKRVRTSAVVLPRRKKRRCTCFRGEVPGNMD